MLATKMYASNHTISSSKNAINATKQTAEFPKVYSFLLFLLAMGALWLERKL
jgi:hypothetical protein